MRIKRERMRWPRSASGRSSINEAGAFDEGDFVSGVPAAARETTALKKTIKLLLRTRHIGVYLRWTGQRNHVREDDAESVLARRRIELKATSERSRGRAGRRWSKNNGGKSYALKHQSRKLSWLMRVLAIDASLRNCGVAIIHAEGGKFSALHFGTIPNKPTLRPSSCLVAIHDRIAELIHQHEPDCCALESVIYVQSYKTAIALGAARGAAILAAAERGLPVFEYAPKRIKQATVGHGSADKGQMAFMVRALLGLTETPGPDAADALAIGLTHLRAQESARLGVPIEGQI